MRSLLFVPGDSIRKFEKARASEADALILDLEDSVAAGAKDNARLTLASMLDAPRNHQKLFVRINAMDTGLSLADLAAVMPHRPDGIVLPKSGDGEDIRRLSHWLDAFEISAGSGAGETKIIAIVTETADALFRLGSYKDASPRLWGMMWGAEDLAASFGALTNRHEGTYSSPFLLARNLCLAGAAAAGVVAIDTICADIHDLAALSAEAQAARRDGFGAKAIIHPNHIGPVNDAFTPGEQEIAWARQVVAAFTANPGAGVINIAGRMIDKPHERMARRIIDAVNRMS